MFTACLISAVFASVFQNRLARTFNSILQLYDEIEIEPPAYFNKIVVDSLQLKEFSLNQKTIQVKVSCSIRVKVILQTSIPAQLSIKINRSQTPKSEVKIQLESYALNLLNSVLDVETALAKASRETEEKIDKVVRELDLSRLQMSEVGSRTSLKIKKGSR